MSSLCRIEISVNWLKVNAFDGKAKYHRNKSSIKMRNEQHNPPEKNNNNNNQAYTFMCSTYTYIVIAFGFGCVFCVVAIADEQCVNAIAI